MTSLQKLAWLSLSGFAFSQANVGFIEFLAPQKDEVVAANSTYVLKWAAKSSITNGTITLLGGQTFDSMRRVGEIAHVTGGNFSWRVESPTFGAQLSHLYGLIFSLDGSEGVFNFSPLFKIVSAGDSSSDGGRSGRDSDDTGVHTNRDVSGHNNLVAVDNGIVDSRDEMNEVTKGQISGENSESVASITSSLVSVVPYTSSPTSPTAISTAMSPEALPTDEPSRIPEGAGDELGTSVITGVVVGATAVLAAFGSSIGLILYYRRRPRSAGGPSSPEKSSDPEIDGKFIKAELDSEGPQITQKRLYELNATREIQEADGYMKPGELDHDIFGPGSPVPDARREIISTESLESLVAKVKVWDTKRGYATV